LFSKLCMGCKTCLSPRGCEVSLTEAPHTHTHDDPHLPRLRETKERLN